MIPAADRTHVCARAIAKAQYIANPERARIRARKWRADNPEHLRTKAAARYVRDGESIRAYARAWGKINHGGARRRARIARVLATLTPQEWDAILEAAGYACIYCGSRKQLTQDHLIPISRGGPHTAENVAPACGPCNYSKGAKAVAEFLAEAS